MFKTKAQRTSLEVQWLRLHAPSAQHPGLIPGQGTRSHMPHRRLKILHATTKTRHSQIKKQINIFFLKEKKSSGISRIFYFLGHLSDCKLDIQRNLECTLMNSFKWHVAQQPGGRGLATSVFKFLGNISEITLSLLINCTIKRSPTKQSPYPYVWDFFVNQWLLWVGLRAIEYTLKIMA